MGQCPDLDKRLGLDQPISRRDFLDGVLLTSADARFLLVLKEPVKSVLAGGPSSRASNRRPNLHRCGGAVGPRIVGNEGKSGRVLLGSFRPVAEV